MPEPFLHSAFKGRHGGQVNHGAVRPDMIKLAWWLSSPLLFATTVGRFMHFFSENIFIRGGNGAFLRLCYLYMCKYTLLILEALCFTGTGILSGYRAVKGTL